MTTQIQPVCAHDDETIMAHVRHALTLGIPDANPAPIERGTIHLYANGPSAADAPLQWPCMALNGALGLFERDNHGPTYWAACDAGEIVASFLGGFLPQPTIYLPASRCHPDIFKALRHRNAYLWHTADASARVLENKTLVRSGVSITITALFLLQWFGFTHVIVHGWDCCYSPNGRGHAVLQPEDRNEEMRYRSMDGRWFATRAAWVAELEDARDALQYLHIDVEVRGPGLIAHELGEAFRK